MSSTQEFNEAQLAAARTAAWTQAGTPLLTLEAARDWVNDRGLVLFAPRAQQLPAPAPSFVEATLGAENAAPTLAETETARGLVARLAGEGLALPLNLLGVPGDSPDFVVSAQVFSYIFTMRGDKAWKQPPSTSGAVKVSPLGLKVFEVLTERGPMSAAELASELGREVTETAILRVLSELWSQLRVLPLLQQGEGATLWELTSRRFTKAIKAGANAGQPTALSALVSLYLAQVFAASEEEITTFLSPLTARSRVREVLHALLGARQLETVVIDGKTLLHMPGGLPAAAAPVAEDGASASSELAVDSLAASEPAGKIGTGRIKRFTSERKPASEFRGKPAGRSFSAGRSAGARPSARPSARSAGRPVGGPSAREGKPDRERRPFKRDAAPGKRPSFAKPWEEDRKPRPEGKPDSFTKFRKPAPEDRQPLGAREQAGLPAEKRSFSRPAKPSFSRAAKPDRGARPDRGAKPDRAGKPGGFAKRPYAPRPVEGGERAPFKPRPRSFERNDGERGPKPGGFAAKRPYTPRSSEGGERPFAKRPYTPRTGDGGAKRPYTPARSEASGERTLPKRPYKPRSADADQRPFTKAPWVPKTDVDAGPPKRSFKPRGEGGAARSGAGPRTGFGGKPSGSFGGKPGTKFGGRPGTKFGSRPGSKFAGKPGVKFGGKSFGAKRSGPAGGVKPSPRKRPEAEE